MMPSHGLYAITDQHRLTDTDRLLSQVESALRGGARIIQYRDKSTDPVKRLQQACALRQLCQTYQCPLLINDDAQLARLSQADGVHLGQQDGSIAAAREYLGPGALIGATCHARLELALTARQAGADYVAFGAFFPSTSKPGASPAPLRLLQQARQQLDCPIVAIGGITVDNGAPLINAGADFLAVIQALFSATDITRQARAFSQLF